MWQRRAAAALLGIALVTLILAPRGPAAWARPVTHAQVVYRSTLACVARVRAGLAVAEAWAWSLCFDEGTSCAQRLAAQRPGRVVRLWLACGTSSPGP